MQALVLTSDSRAEIAELMIARYNQIWPQHPFTFRIPYQSESRKLTTWGGGKRHWIPSPKDPKGTLEALSTGVDEWCYLAIDEWYPEKLNGHRFKRVLQFLEQSESSALQGILMCKGQKLMASAMTGKHLKANLNNERLCWLNAWHLSWPHGFFRSTILKELIDNTPRLAVLENDAVVLSKSLHEGTLMLNAIESLRREGRAQPIDFPVYRNRSGSVGSLTLTMGERVKRVTRKMRLRLAKIQHRPMRYHSLFHHPAGWEIYMVLQTANPDGNFVFFDIGANNGSSSIQYARWFPAAQGVLFEAHPEIASQAQANLNQARLSQRLRVVPIALSDQSSTLSFHVSTHSSGNNDSNGGLGDSSSLLAPKDHLKTFPGIEFNSTLEVQTMRAEDWLAGDGSETPAFVHLDVQGAELLVLEGFGEQLDKVKAVWMEVSWTQLYCNAPGVKEVAEWMESRGFICAVHGVGPTYGDQLWLRPELGKYSPEQRRLFELTVDHRIQRHHQTF